MIPLNAYYFDVITNTSHYECYDERHGLTRKEDLKHRLKLLKNITDRGWLSEVSAEPTGLCPRSLFAKDSAAEEPDITAV